MEYFVLNFKFKELRKELILLKRFEDGRCTIHHSHDYSHDQRERGGHEGLAYGQTDGRDCLENNFINIGQFGVALYTVY